MLCNDNFMIVIIIICLEKSRVFRIEEVNLPPYSTDSQSYPSSSVTTQTSPQAPPTTSVPAHTAAITISQSPVVNSTQQIAVAGGGVQMQSPQVVSGVQYIAMPGHPHQQQPLFYPSIQSLPYIMAQVREGRRRDSFAGLMSFLIQL